ncbi:MAG: hypothetical protein Kow00106_12400 [Anaerolineae bacterium]
MTAQDIAPAPIAALFRAEALRAIRRLDWRFLLPDPALGRVVYVGGEQSDLLTALRVSGLDVTALTGEPSSAARASFATAVMVNPSPREVALAAMLLRPGGWLYAEVNGARAARRLAKQLSGAGCGSVQLYWHWPDFARCTRILPLDDAGALVYGLVKGRGGAQGKAVTWLVRTRALHWVARSVSVVAQRGNQ